MLLGGFHTADDETVPFVEGFFGGDVGALVVETHAVGVVAGACGGGPEASLGVGSASTSDFVFATENVVVGVIAPDGVGVGGATVDGGIEGFVFATRAAGR